jgi:phosphoribosyl 1,2-cyclic phosphodiesterase
LKIQSIASSSSGCAYAIDNGKNQLLIECGVNLKQIRAALDYDLSRVAGCLVSHEHGDHAKYLPKLEEETPIPIYCTEGTKIGYNLGQTEIIKKNRMIKIGDFVVIPVKLVHDVECFGFVIRSGNEILYYATDTGKVSMNLIPGLKYLMIECNHSLEILAESPVEYKDRITKYHLDIDSVIEFCLIHQSTLHEIHLLHLSDRHSDAKLFHDMVSRETGIPVYVAGK